MMGLACRVLSCASVFVRCCRSAGLLLTAAPRWPPPWQEAVLRRLLSRGQYAALADYIHSAVRVATAPR